MSVVQTLSLIDPVASNLHIALSSDNVGPRPQQLRLPVSVPGHNQPTFQVLLLPLHGQETLLRHQVVSQVTWYRFVVGQGCDFSIFCPFVQQWPIKFAKDLTQRWPLFVPLALLFQVAL